MNATKQQMKTPSKSAPENLEAGAATFRERAATYGKSYVKFGEIMADTFPDGLHIDGPDKVANFIRLGVLVQIVSKVTRYAEQLTRGGHRDSAHDIMVYAAMLEEVTQDPNDKNDHAKT